MKTVGLYGCGALGSLIVNALIEGYLPQYRLIGTFSRTKKNAEDLAERINSFTQKESCTAVASQEDLLALKPDYIVEAASPKALRRLVIPALKNQSSLVCLSIGAFADKTFFEEVKQTAEEHSGKVHLVSGAIGGFDVLQTAALMENSTVSFNTEKGPKSLRNTSVYKKELEKEKQTVFSGNAKEAISLFPTKVNVAVAAALASAGPEKTQVSINSVPDYVGDKHSIQIKNKQVEANISIYSKTAEIAGWSVVNTLRNIASPIEFG